MKAGLAGRNIVTLLKEIILRYIGICFYIVLIMLQFCYYHGYSNLNCATISSGLTKRTKTVLLLLWWVNKFAYDIIKLNFFASQSF